MDLNKKSIICILAAVMLLSVAIPSFASSGSEDAEVQNTETATETVEQTDQAEEAEETVQAGEEDQTGSGTIESAEGSEQLQETKPEEAPAVTESQKKAEAQAVNGDSGLPENNTKISYTSAGSHPVKFTVKSGDYTFRGTCATLGAENAKSGKATVKRVGNNTRIAKLVYYYGYKKGWWQGTNSSKKATAVLGFTDKNCTENAKQCIEALIQRDNMGWSAFWAARKNGKYRMYSTDSFVKEINDLYKNTDVSKITIPDDVIFEMFHGVTSSSKVQDFYVWRYKRNITIPNGFVAVEKVSGDVSITK